MSVYGGIDVRRTRPQVAWGQDTVTKTWFATSSSTEVL
jgi:hypothetical protein